MSFSFPPRKDGMMAFIKMHGLRNHFVFADAREFPFRPSATEICQICNLTQGIGAEEFIVFEPATSEDEDFFMRIYNQDGKEAEACINATRCAALIYFEEQNIDQAKIRTSGGILFCKKTGDRQIKIQVGRPKNAWAEIPLSKDMDSLHLGLKQGPLEDGTAINFGNPHTVFFVDDLDEVDLMRDAYPIYEDRLFPNQTNVEAAKIIAPNLIEMKVLERPGIITAACGSGACATYAAAKRNGLTEEKSVTVRMPAGDVLIEEADSGEIFLTGPAEFCFSGHYFLSETET